MISTIVKSVARFALISKTFGSVTITITDSGLIVFPISNSAACGLSLDELYYIKK